MQSENKQIIAEKIKKTYKSKKIFSPRSVYKAVDNVSLEVYSGEILGVVGKNGAGKTSLIKMLCGIMKPDSGKISILGYTPFKREKQYCKKVSLVMGQKGQMDEDISIFDNAVYMASIYGLSNKKAISEIEENAKLLDLNEQLYQQVRTLSLGQRMKGELLIAFLHKPQIVFLDEPTLGLDFTTQKEIRFFLIEYVKKNNASIILTSHNIDDIQSLCERIIILDKGETIFYGKISELKQIIQSHKYIIFECEELIGELEDIVVLNDDKYVIEVKPENETKIMSKVLQCKQVRNVSLVETDLNEIIEELYRRVAMK